ncbi:MAG: exodeoxyribonuclease III [Gammaproteobacteria bacterium]
MKIATWNVNSLKVRLPQVLSWLQQHQPDVLALQETKLSDNNFPVQEIEAAGYYVTFSGQPTYNGVAILAKYPLQDVSMQLPGFDDEQRRVITATIDGIRVINVYIPNGATLDSDKYVYKLNWLDQLHHFVKTELAQHEKLVILGDFNIAPTDADVHDPIAWAGQVLVSEPEREHFRILLNLGLKDSFRLFDQPPKTYSWWDYRMLAFRRNHGLRIDHILVSETLARQCTLCTIDKEARKHERPSDHAPVFVEI